jgi:GNAT superfamily N-acetyltransferase
MVKNVGVIRVETIADHLELVPTIARWHWEEWGHVDPDGSLATWTAGLRRRTRRNQVPTTFVAIDGGTPVGSVTLVVNDMPDRHEFAELTPWVAGAYVVESARGRGVGTALIRHAVEQARQLDLERLYLYTSTAESFYTNLGWNTIARTRYEGDDVAVMTLGL